MKALCMTFPASDYAASKAFYEQTIGLPIRKEYEGEPHRYTDYDLGGVFLKIFEWTEKWNGHGHSGLLLETGSLDEMVERIKDRRDGKAHKIVVTEWGGRCCTVSDPFGNLFDLVDANQKGDL